MGMAAAQCRFFQYTTRKNDIGLQLSRLSNDKVELSRDRQNASRAYQEALSSKTLKWSNNGGVSYIDLTYSSLMSPSAMNQQEPCILTDSKDRVVVDSKYQKYAEMIAPNGVSNGTYASRRAEILANLVGVEESKFGEQVEKNADLKKAQDVVKALLSDPTYTSRGTYIKDDIGGLLLKLGNSGTDVAGTTFEGATNWQEAYNNGAVIKFTTKDQFLNIIAKIRTLSEYYPGVDKNAFEKAFKARAEAICEAFDKNGELKNGDSDDTKKNRTELDSAVQYDKQNNCYLLDVYSVVGALLSQATQPVDAAKGNTWIKDGSNYKSWVNTSHKDYAIWKPKYEKWIKDYDQAQAALKEAEYANQSVFTADEERKIAFYDAIFTSIDEKGWVYNDKINDNNYLNNMLQNGNYYLTTKTPSLYKEVGKDKKDYDYFSQLAVNNEHVFLVNNTDAQNEAITEYEYKKSIISAKETRIDTRMKSLETELSAVNTMMQSIESLLKENIESGFKCMS